MTYYRKPATPKAELSEQDGMIAVKASYDAGMVAWLKALPTHERSYIIDSKVWLIDPKHGTAAQKAIKQFIGLDVSLPQIKAVAAAESVEVFEIRYLGGARNKGSSERMATGYVGQMGLGEWKVIFGELALRKYFGESNPRPGDARTRYGAIGVSGTASDEEIKRAYRRVSRMWHPDVCQESDATVQFQAIQNSYEILSDASRRAKYDAGLRLQQTIGGGQRESGESVYYSPLRCGVVTARVRPIVGGRFIVVEISDWKDILQDGRMLITTWPQGASMFLEKWVEAAR